MTARDLMRRARELWPNSRNYRKQWARSTMRLIQSGKHVLHGAPATWGNRRGST